LGKNKKKLGRKRRRENIKKEKLMDCRKKLRK